MRPSYVDALSAVVETLRLRRRAPATRSRTSAPLGAAATRFPARTYLPDSGGARPRGRQARVCWRVCARRGVAVPADRSTSRADGDRRGDREAARGPRACVGARPGRRRRARLAAGPHRRAGASRGCGWWIDEKGMAASDFMASEMLPGREFAYQSVWQDGQLVAGQARERVEYLYGHLTPSGQTSTPSVARTVRRARRRRPRAASDPRARPAAARRVLRRHQGVGRRHRQGHRDQRGPVLHDVELLRGRGPQHARHARPRARSASRSTPTGPHRRSTPDLYWIRMVDMGYVLVSGARSRTVAVIPFVSGRFGPGAHPRLRRHDRSTPIDWSALRAELGVQRIDDLWHVAPDRWDIVTAAEVGAGANGRARCRGRPKRWRRPGASRF